MAMVPEPETIERLRKRHIATSEAVAAALRARLDGIRIERCPVAGLRVGGAVWVSPDLRARVAYRCVTTAGELRHASVKGLED